MTVKPVLQEPCSAPCVRLQYYYIFLRILSRQNLISSILASQAEADVAFTKVQFCQRNNARHLSESKDGLLGFV